MATDKTAVEAFLEGDKNDSMFEAPKDPFFKVEEPQGEVIEEVEKEEKPLPFNKDPKIQRFIEKAVEKRLSEFKPQEVERETKSETDDYWERLIGTDTAEKLQMVKEAKQREERLLDQAEERTFSRLSQRDQEAERADREAEEELDNAFESIEQNYDVDISSNTPQARKARQEFVSFVERIAPKNSEGEVIDYPDMHSAWETFSEIKKQNPQNLRAKELAQRGISRSAETSVKQDKSVNWNTVDEFMDTLK